MGFSSDDIDHAILCYVLDKLGENANSETTVDINALKHVLASNFPGFPVHELPRIIDSLLGDYRWLGLGWKEESKDDLFRIPGLHWFASSSMYRNLLQNRYERLGGVLADVVEHAMPNAFDRLLVDAGSTVFWCLHHRRCQLVERAKEVQTNNVFVAQHLRGRHVKLIGGEWDVDTGAMVRCGDIFTGGLSAMMRTKGRQPTVALLSYHFVTASDKDEVILWTKSDVEDDMKRVACLGCTRDRVFIVLDKDKLGLAPPTDAKGIKPIPYSLSDLARTQRDEEDAGKNSSDLARTQRDEEDAGKKRQGRRDYLQRREIYIVSDLQKGNPEQMKIADLIASKQYADNRIFFVSPYKVSKEGLKVLS